MLSGLTASIAPATSTRPRSSRRPELEKVVETRSTLQRWMSKNQVKIWVCDRLTVHALWTRSTREKLRWRSSSRKFKERTPNLHQCVRISKRRLMARNGHAYLDVGRRSLEDNGMETVLRK